MYTILIISVKLSESFITRKQEHYYQYRTSSKERNITMQLVLLIQRETHSQCVEHSLNATSPKM